MFANTTVHVCLTCNYGIIKSIEGCSKVKEYKLCKTLEFISAGSPITQPGIPAIFLRPTACVRAAWLDCTVRRATSTAAFLSTLPLSSWEERAPASGAVTPTLRGTSPSLWDAPVCRCCRKSETTRRATRAWREQGQTKASRSQARKYEGSRATVLQISFYTPKPHLLGLFSPRARTVILRDCTCEV